MKYLIGSRALNFWYPNEFPIKETTDWDIVTDEYIKPTPQIDIVGKDLPTLESVTMFNYDIMDSPVGKVKVCSPISLMLVKRSHLHRPVNFQKHIRHYHFLLQNYPNRSVVWYKILEKLTKVTKEKYGDRTPKLNKTKREFFDDFVTKKYEHDDIHYATCYGERPIYEELKTNDEKVWCSRAKWDCISHEKRIQCILEEAYVISIERFLIPNRKFPPKFAFFKSLEKICTTLTSGWFRDYAIENWPELMSYAEYDFYGRFIEKEYTLIKIS